MSINEEEWKQLNRQVNLLKKAVYALAVALFFAVGGCWFFVETHQEVSSVFTRLETQKLVITDAQGNDRIILAPIISDSPTRLRKDTVEGILILDENGVDRVALGATPTVKIGPRIVKRVQNDVPYGFVFNDETGTERGGFGYYAKRGLVSFGMDHPTAKGLSMFVADKDHYGQKVGLVMSANTGVQTLYIGSDITGTTMLNLDSPVIAERLSISIDSTGSSAIPHYTNSDSKVLLKNK